jgi:phosphopantetheinyl transferase
MKVCRADWNGRNILMLYFAYSEEIEISIVQRCVKLGVDVNQICKPYRENTEHSFVSLFFNKNCAEVALCKHNNKLVDIAILKIFAEAGAKVNFEKI